MLEWQTSLYLSLSRSLARSLARSLSLSLCARHAKQCGKGCARERTRDGEHVRVSPNLGRACAGACAGKPPPRAAGAVVQVLGRSTGSGGPIFAAVAIGSLESPESQRQRARPVEDSDHHNPGLYKYRASSATPNSNHYALRLSRTRITITAAPPTHPASQPHSPLARSWRSVRSRGGGSRPDGLAGGDSCPGSIKLGSQSLA